MPSCELTSKAQGLPLELFLRRPHGIANLLFLLFEKRDIISSNLSDRETSDEQTVIVCVLQQLLRREHNAFAFVDKVDVPPHFGIRTCEQSSNKVGSGTAPPLSERSGQRTLTIRFDTELT